MKNLYCKLYYYKNFIVSKFIQIEEYFLTFGYLNLD